MAGPHSLDRDALLHWLDGIVPPWSLLDRASLRRLLLAPSEPDAAVRLSAELKPSELTASAVVMNAPILLGLGLEGGGLKLTAGGNLQRGIVRRLCQTTTWPDFDLRELLSYYQSPNEEHAWPVLFLRLLSVRAGLLRKHRGTLVSTRLAKSLLADSAAGKLQSSLFEAAGWRVNLAYVDRMPLERWPQAQFGLVLWTLCRAAKDWQTPDRLTRSCALPEAELLAMPRQWPRWALEIRILRPLQLFGLLEVRSDRLVQQAGPSLEQRSYRKAPLFDRFLSFDVHVDDPPRVLR